MSKKTPVTRTVKPKPAKYKQVAKRKQAKASVGAATKTRSKVTSTQSVTKGPKRLNPDELPGAVRSYKRMLLSVIKER